MALYSTQFYLSNDETGSSIDAWNAIKKYKGLIKHPHFDIGSYDMLDYATRKKQAIMAKKYGISAFCYEHFWFNGQSIMSKGLEKIVEDGEPDLPFSLCWANDPSTNLSEVLNRQNRVSNVSDNPADWIEHYLYLSQFFKHPLYIKEDNCPILYIQKMVSLKMLDMWQEMAKKDGFNGLKFIPFCVCNLINDTNIKKDNLDNQGTYISDNSCIFHLNLLKNPIDQLSLYKKILDLEPLKPGCYHSCYGIFYDFHDICTSENNSERPLIKLSYKAFEYFLQNTIVKCIHDEQRANNYIILNSWNNWLKQSMFEPNDHDGYELLKIIRKYFATT